MTVSLSTLYTIVNTTTFETISSYNNITSSGSTISTIIMVITIKINFTSCSKNNWTSITWSTFFGFIVLTWSTRKLAILYTFAIWVWMIASGANTTFTIIAYFAFRWTLNALAFIQLKSWSASCACHYILCGAIRTWNETTSTTSWRDSEPFVANSAISEIIAN